MMDTDFSLSNMQRILLLSLSFLVVAFGQPVWSDKLALVAAIGGFASFWRVLLSFPSAKKRFYLGLGWFGAVQAIQLVWFASHPYLYIYGVILFCCVLTGVQWGVFSIFIQPRLLRSPFSLFALPGLWTLLEWSRLFVLSGLPFNPVGLTFSGSLYSLQFASLAGVYGLSFWVILTNLLVLRAWMQPSSFQKWVWATCAAIIPFVFGWMQLHNHDALGGKKGTVLLVQPALPIEENLRFQSAEEARQFVLDEWRQILSPMQPHLGKKVDLIVFPEYIVPYGTFHSVYHFEGVQRLFHEIFGPQALEFISKESPYAEAIGQQAWVSNAFLAQAVADLFNAHLVIGLEDSTYAADGRKKVEAFSSAFHFVPGSPKKPERYEKRVLVPMGEYIPFDWCRQIAAQYGISGSFTSGTTAKVFHGPVLFGVSICYEEIYGELMRENRVQGAEMLVNLTNDGWFPHSLLPKQHFDHARLRTVENGIPLVRACNTGVTGAIDSLGRIVALLGEDHMAMQNKAGALLVDLPLYHYQTLYSRFGDLPILALSAFGLAFFFYRFRLGSFK